MDGWYQWAKFEPFSRLVSKNFLQKLPSLTFFFIFVLLKGYVAVNGASLTVAKRDESSFSVYLIPETLEATNLSEITEESFLNIEVDQSTYASMKRPK